MAEILSQSQIDALLKNFSTNDIATEAESNEKKIKEYDFRSPKKFTKEQLKTMDSLHESLSRTLTSYFASVLRVFAEVTVLQIEEQRYYEYSNALSDTSLVGLVEVKPSNKAIDETTFLIDLAPRTIFSIIDRLLGGTGDGYNYNRDFTDIELAIMNNVYVAVVQRIQESWAEYMDININLSSIETNARLIQVYSPDDIVVIVLLNVKLKNLEGVLSVCIPAIGLEELLGEFIPKYAKQVRKVSDKSKEEIRRSVIMDYIESSDIDMKAVFKDLTLDLQDIINLQVNDVITLNEKINSDICLTVDDTPWFTGKLGSVKTKKAVKIESIAKSE